MECSRLWKKNQRTKESRPLLCEISGALLLALVVLRQAGRQAGRLVDDYISLFNESFKLCNLTSNVHLKV